MDFLSFRKPFGQGRDSARRIDQQPCEQGYRWFLSDDGWPETDSLSGDHQFAGFAQ
jgi:hypothetical protein